MKFCVKCGTIKPLTDYHKEAKAEDGHRNDCKSCKCSANKTRRDKHPMLSRAASSKWKEKNKEKNKEITRSWRLENKDHTLQYEYNYRLANKEKRNLQKEKWRKENLARVRAYSSERYKNCDEHKLNHIIRTMVARVKSKGASVSLPYTSKDLKQRMEAQFKDGMTWSNHGEWEIDHKIPVSLFLKRGVKCPKIINALSNLQPLWKKDNREKNNRWVG